MGRMAELTKRVQLRTRNRLVIVVAFVAIVLAAMFGLYKMFQTEAELEWKDIEMTWEQVPEGITYEQFEQWYKEQNQER